MARIWRKLRYNLYKQCGIEGILSRFGDDTELGVWGHSTRGEGKDGTSRGPWTGWRGDTAWTS